MNENSLDIIRAKLMENRSIFESTYFQEDELMNWFHRNLNLFTAEEIKTIEGIGKKK